MRITARSDSVWPWLAAFLFILAALGLAFGAWDAIAGWLAVIGVLLCLLSLAAGHLPTLAFAFALLGGAAAVAVWQGGSWRWFILPASGVVGWLAVQGVALVVTLWLDRRAWRRRRQRRGPIPVFSVPDDVRRSDADVLVAVALHGDDASLNDLIAAWDYFNRDIPDREEVEHAVRLLAAGGLVEPRGDRLAISDTGRQVFGAIPRGDRKDVVQDVADVLDQHRDPGISLAEWSLSPDAWARAKDAYVFGAINAR